MKVKAEGTSLVVEFERDGVLYRGLVTHGYLRTKLGAYAQAGAAAFAECVNEAYARAKPVPPPEDDEPPPARTKRAA